MVSATGESGLGTTGSAGSSAKNEYLSVEELLENLRFQRTSKYKTTTVTVLTIELENTGNKTMYLFPELLQEFGDPFYIVTRKTLGYSDSLFSKIADLAYAEETVSGGLLKAEIDNPEQIILRPGERVDKKLEIKGGFGSKLLKIRFTTLGETVLEEDIEIAPKELSGLAADEDSENNLLDVYAFFVPSELTKKLEQYYAGQLNSLTGAAVALPFAPDKDRYTLELNIFRKPDLIKMDKMPMKVNLANKVKNRLKSSPEFSDLYGPYRLTENQTFIFAQRLEYNPAVYQGDYVISTTILRENIPLLKSELEVKLE